MKGEINPDFCVARAPPTTRLCREGEGAVLFRRRSEGPALLREAIVRGRGGLGQLGLTISCKKLVKDGLVVGLRKDDTMAPSYSSPTGLPTRPLLRRRHDGVPSGTRQPTTSRPRGHGSSRQALTPRLSSWLDRWAARLTCSNAHWRTRTSAGSSAQGRARSRALTLPSATVAACEPSAGR